MDIFDTRLRELLVQIENKCKENKSKIDCIVPISGGKDGTFMLWFLRRYTNLRLLAFHVDNYYVSETALNNVKNATKTLSTDLIIHRPFWEPTQHIYQRLLKSSGEICIACEYFVSILPLQYAAENDIPYVAYAFTPSQMKAKNMTSVLRKTNYIYYKDLITYYRELCMDLICGEFKDLLGQTWFTPSENMEKRTFPDLLFPLFLFWL